MRASRALILLAAFALAGEAAGQTLTGGGASTAPGGSTGQVQYNNGGAFGGMAVTGSGAVALATSPTLTTPNIGAATAASINGLTITASTGTLTVANGKTEVFNNSITLAGTDGTTMTLPATSATLARTDAAQTFTGVQTFGGQATFNGNVGFGGNRGLYVNGTAYLFQNIAPTCAATGGSPTCAVNNNNGSAAMKITLGAASSVTTMTITEGFTAATGFVCDAFDATTTTERLKQTATTTTTATLTFQNDAGTATSPGASDVIFAKCLAL